MAPRPSEPVLVDLTPRQRRFLVTALGQWGGPADATDALAAVVHFDGKDALYDDLRRLRQAIDHGEALSERDWMRAVLFAGLVISNREIGAPFDWHACTSQSLQEAWDDLASVERLLRQRFIADRPRTLIFSGLHEGRRTRVWTFAPLDEMGSMSWQEHAAAARGPAERRYRERTGTDPEPQSWFDVRVDRHRDGSVRAQGYFGMS